MKKIAKRFFTNWVIALQDSNIEVCLKWFGDGKTFNECWWHLREDWSEQEVAAAFWGKTKDGGVA